MKKVLLFLSLSFAIHYIFSGSTTIVYNINTNSCSGTNMNCEGFVNSVGDVIAWDTKGINITDHKSVSEKTKINVNITDTNPQEIHSFFPTLGLLKGKKIRVLFVFIPIDGKSSLNLPSKVKTEIKKIEADAKNISNKNSEDINAIVKIYRQFGNQSNTTRSEWTEVATLLLPDSTKDCLKNITLDPTGVVTTSSKDIDGTEKEIIIDLTAPY